VGLSMIWLVRILWFMLIGGWAEGGFKLDLRLDCDPGRQDCDPGKQELKGAVRTETHQCHYCQHSSLFCLLRKGGIVFTLASSSWQGLA
jgi:hypothetical protein